MLGTRCSWATLGILAVGLAAAVYAQEDDDASSGGAMSLTDRLRAVSKQVLGESNSVRVSNPQSRPGGNSAAQRSASDGSEDHAGSKPMRRVGSGPPPANHKFGLPARTVRDAGDLEPPSETQHGAASANDRRIQRSPGDEISRPVAITNRPAGSDANPIRQNPSRWSSGRTPTQRPMAATNPYATGSGPQHAPGAARPGAPSAVADEAANAAPAASSSVVRSAAPAGPASTSSAAAVASENPIQQRLKALRTAQRPADGGLAADLPSKPGPTAAADLATPQTNTDSPATAGPQASQSANRGAVLGMADDATSANASSRRVSPPPANATTNEFAQAEPTVRGGAASVGDATGVIIARRNEPTSDSVAAKTPILHVATKGPSKLVIGKSAAYTVAVENSGSAAANDVVVDVKLPIWAEVESTKPSSGEIASAAERGGALQWKISRLEAKAQQTLVLNIIPRQSRPIHLAVQWTFVPEASQTVVDVLEPKLQLHVAGATDTLYGTTESYKFTVSNPGTGDAENVMLAITVTADGGIRGGVERHLLGTIPAGGSKSVDHRLQASEAGHLVIAAKAVGDGELNADTQARLHVRRAALHAEAAGPKSKFAGTPGTYRLRIANTGDATAENVHVEVAMPSGAKLQQAGPGGSVAEDRTKVVWTIPTLRAGAEQVYEVSCVLHSPGENLLRIAAVAQGKLSAAATASTLVEALADLKLEVVDPTGPVAVGASATYEVHIRNRGTKAAENVTLITYFSEGIEPTAVAGSSHKIEEGQVTCDPIRSLAPGDEATIKITAKASAPGNHVFRAEVTSRNPDTRLIAEETTAYYADGATLDTTPKPTPSSKPNAFKPVPSAKPATASVTDSPASSANTPASVPHKLPIPAADRYGD